MSNAAKSPLVGTWKLVAFQFEFENGAREDAYTDASGFLVITADGRMFATLADNARRLTDAPSSLFDRMMAYTGRYRIEGDDAFVVDVDVSWHPSWLGTKQTRYFNVEGDRLWIISAPQQHPKHPGRTIRGIITWRRE